MSQQRTVIYDLRAEALEAEAGFGERIQDMIAETVDEILEPHFQLGGFTEEWELPRAAAEVAEALVAPVPALPWGEERVEKEEAQKFFQDFALAAYEARRRDLTP